MVFRYETCMLSDNRQEYMAEVDVVGSLASQVTVTWIFAMSKSPSDFSERL